MDNWELWKQQNTSEQPESVKALVSPFIDGFEAILKEHPQMSQMIGLPMMRYSGTPNPEVQIGPFIASPRMHFEEPFKVPEDVSEFAHFTTLEAAGNILSTGQLRLYNPDYGNDPKEVVWAASDCVPPDIDVKRAIQELFVISFCAKESVDDLTMWKLYGGDGQGVALIFEMLNPTSNWHDWYLGKIQYLSELRTDEFHNHIKSFYNSIVGLQNRLPQQLTFSVAFLPLLAFYKSSLFSSEKEFRLLFINKFEGSNRHYTGHWNDDHMNPNKKCGIRTYHTINKRFQHGYYCTYPIYWHGNQKSPEEYSFFNKGPQLRLKEVILGYNHNSERAHKMSTWYKSFIPKLVGKENVESRYSVEFTISKLAEYFESKS